MDTTTKQIMPVWIAERSKEEQEKLMALRAKAFPEFTAKEIKRVNKLNKQR